jgi:hypothetical protein
VSSEPEPGEQAEYASSSQRLRKRRRGVIVVVLVIGVAVCFPILLHSKGNAILRLLIGSCWNSEADVKEIKHYVDTASLLMIVVCSVVFILTHFKILTFSERKRTSLEIINWVVVLLTAYMTISVSPTLGDRASELSPLSGITSRYSLDGSQLHNVFGLIVQQPTREIEVFKQMILYQNAGDWTNLSVLCDKQVAKTPDWPTPYFARALAEANLGHNERARRDCEYTITHAHGDPSYTGATNLLRRLDLISACEKKYSALNNRELKNEALRLIGAIRAFADQSEASERLALDAEREQEIKMFRGDAAFQTNRQALATSFRASMDARMKRDSQTSSNYADQFGIAALTLQKELLSRIPKGRHPAVQRSWFVCWPSYWTYREVPDALGTLARTLPNAGNTIYTDLNNKQLREETIRLVQQIRTLPANRVQRSSAWDRYVATTNQAERSRFWIVEDQESRKREDKIAKEYTDRFRVAAMMLQEELVERFPKGNRPVVRHGIFMMDPAFFTYEEVPATLEKLARTLPNSD